MKLLKSLCIIFGFSFLGDMLHSLFNLPIPGSIIGLLLLFIGLYTKVLDLDLVENSGTSLQKNMGFLFIPLMVGLIDQVELLKLYGFNLLIVIIVTTSVTYIIVAKVSQKVTRHE